MKVPMSWLREFVPVEAGTDEVAERLSLTGLTVEEVVRVGAGVEGVVVGRVLAVRDHPDADNLVLVDVDTGAGARGIVCGARNFAPGDLVPVAVPGSKLPGGVEIGARTVRGQKSDGMLCSARELRVSDDHSGILVLPGDATLGADVRAALGLDDEVLDIDVLPNRPDALSVIGVAREVAALFGLPFSMPDPDPAESGPPVQTLASVEVSDPRGCPRYLARVVTGVRVGESPWWLRRRLLACGVRPLSNVVDVTNYVMLERGQPLHGFDLGRLQGRRIVVRRPAARESLRTLDGGERTLKRDDVVICDASAPVAVAGVMGGEDTEVGPATAEVLIESAAFDPIRVLRTARRLGMRTEASVRFERGVDPAQIAPAAARAAALIAEIGGGAVAAGVLDAARPSRPRRPISLSMARASSLVGVTLDPETTAASLRAIGCEAAATTSRLRVVPPTHRPDILAPEDVIEEIARLYGYTAVPSALPHVSQGGELTARQRARRLVRRTLLGAGLSEAHTLSLLPQGYADLAGLPAGDPLRRAHRVANPLAEDESVMRTSLVPGLLLAARRNVARGVRSVALFEIGTVFGPADGLPEESEWVAFVLAGSAPASWHVAARPSEFSDAKGIAEALLSGIGILGAHPGNDTLRFEPATDATLHPGRSAAVLLAGEQIGVVGEIPPRTARALDLPPRTAVGAFAFDALAGAVREHAPAEVPRVPGAHRDLAVVVPEGTAARDVVLTVTGAAGPLLRSVAPFDVYRGSPLPEGTLSLALALSFGTTDRTLTDAEVDGAIAAAVAALSAKGWSLRD